MVVELFHGRKETFDFGVPRQGGGDVPGLLALRDREPPVKQITHVREDLRGRARLVSDMEAGEVVRSAAQSFAGAVGDGGDGVAKKLPRGIGGWGHRCFPPLSRVATKSLNAETSSTQKKKRRESPHP